MRDATVLVFVAASLSNILGAVVSTISSHHTCAHTDFSTGPFARTVGWKLNGFGVGSPFPLLLPPAGKSDMEPNVGLFGGFIPPVSGEPAAGDVLSTIGESELGSKDGSEEALSSTGESSGGGVGVRGGWGIGRLEAMAKGLGMRTCLIESPDPVQRLATPKIAASWRSGETESGDGVMIAESRSGWLRLSGRLRPLSVIAPLAVTAAPPHHPSN